MPGDVFSVGSSRHPFLGMAPETGRPPAALGRLRDARTELWKALRTDDQRLPMRKHAGTWGDFWDAFTCAVRGLL